MTPSPTGTPLNPYSNAPALPFSVGRDWFAQARRLLLSYFLFFPMLALVVLAARWQLDFLEGGIVILLSYLSDALVFALVFLGVRDHLSGAAVSAFAGGRLALKGRVRAVLLSGLWGLPAALGSYLIFAFAPQLIRALVLALGVNGLGVASMLLLVLVGGYATFWLCMLPVLAAIQVARDPEATFKLGGLWAFRGLRSGWRPLLVVFVSFITGCFAAAAVLTRLFGHLPGAFFEGDASVLAQLQYWYAWPGLFIAMTLFLAMLHPMAHDLLRAADTDLSDEIFTSQDKPVHGTLFLAAVLDGSGFALRCLACTSVLFALLYTGFFGMAASGVYMPVAVAAYLWGGNCYQSAIAWRTHAGAMARYRFVWAGLLWALAAVVVIAFSGVAQSLL